MQDFGQWLPQTQSSGDFYFSSLMLDTSLEMQTGSSAVALLGKESAHAFGITSAAGPVEVSRHDSGAIEEVQNGAGPTEVIDLNNTPPPKAKRKKHRPKVFKPPKAPKAATPKPAKAKEEKPSGKRKYVRKNTQAGQPPPEQTADSLSRSKPKPVKRRLNVDGDALRESAQLGYQSQLRSTDPKDYQPCESSTSQSNVQTQLPCHVDFTTSSMYSSANQMAGAQLLPADNTETAIYSSANEIANAQFLPARYIPKGILLDLNSSTDQMQNECANFVDRPAQFFQSVVRGTLQQDPLLEACTGMPGKNLPDLNSSISLMQGMPTNFTEYLLSSPQASVRETQMDKQMFNCHRIPENSFTTAQCSEGVAMRENFITNPYLREAWATDQMSHGYRSTQNPISPPKHIEGHSMIANLNDLTPIDYLKFPTSSYMQTGGALGPHGSRGSSHMHALDTRGEHNASNGAHILSGVNFNQQRNGWTSVDACHTATSQGSYFPENYKRMRTDNHSNHLNGAVGNISTPSMHLSNNRNTNVVSTINSNVFTLADAQRLIVREKSRASRGMISFGASRHNMLKRPEMIQQHYRPAMHGTAYRDSVEAPDEHFRLITEKFTQFPSNVNTLRSQSFNPRTGSHQHQFLEGNTVKGSDLPVELNKHNTPSQDDTCNSFCIGASHEVGRSISGKKNSSPVIPTTQSKDNDTLEKNSCPLESSGEVIRLFTNPINSSPGTDVLRNENHQVEVCGETTAAKTSEKRKVGRPRKEIKPGEIPKPRGRPRKEKVAGTELMSKDSHTDQLQNEGICSVSGHRVVEAPCFKGLNTERSRESFPGAIAPLADLDPLDLIIQKIKVLHISKSDDTGTPEPHGALVPYKGESGAIVPYEGKVKRKHARVKVNLDPVTALMWKLLMEPDMVDGSEEMDKDKEKWLDEERKIFRGRIDSFIARMHLVQGDRRFSPWKGSVVDSVVGVFLTQNVSDHLSSSAFMALAAKFPAKPEVSRIPASRMFHAMSEENGDCSGLFGDSVKLQGGILVEEASHTTGSLVITEEEGSNSVGLFENSPGDGVDCAAGVYCNSYGTLPVRLHESKTLAAGTKSVVEAEDVALEDVVSSQDSAISSQSSPDYLFNMTDHMFPSTYVNFTAEDSVGRNMPNGTSNSTTYTELLRMQELKSKFNEKIGLSEYDRFPEPCANKGSMPSEVHHLSSKHQPLHASVSRHHNGQAHLPDLTHVSYLERSAYNGFHSNDTRAETIFNGPLPTPGIDSDKTKMADSLTALLYDVDGSLSQEKIHFPSATTRGADFISPIMDKYFHPSCSETVSFAKEHSIQNNLSRNDAVAAFVEQHVSLNLQEKFTTKAKQIGGEKHQSGCSQQYDNVGLLKNKDGSHFSSNLYQSEKSNSPLLQDVASDSVEKPKDTKKAFLEVPADKSKTKKTRAGARKKKTYDWDILRKEVIANRGNEERGQNAKDALDWETIRQIDVKEISDTIRERGMNNMLSERIKAFLNRLVTDHGAIDLEWLRYVDPDKAKEYLLSIRGLGLKSVECVRLLTLHHMAFPVDTNVGRICVRLGWVPLQPLPESLQLHLLELYPMLENIQKYLWPRLCKLDQRTLYELHYQMITFGKVFCTKSKPNCNACPMRAECKHFASAFASARLALPGPEEKSLVTTGKPIAAESCHQPYISSRPVNQLEWNSHAHDHVLDNRQPIIEEPASPEPEPETAEIKESAIEDLFFDDPEEIPTIKLNFEEFAQNLKNYMQVNNIEIEDADMSNALVAITPEAASIPTPKLKNISRLRTEHQVYELPDSHPLLEGYDQREPDDPCPYLLSIWTPGETAQSTDAPKTSCNSYESGELCDSSACFSCNSIREAQAQKVRGTILVPCRTAMRGSFPLNGTYFQVNEVFADHDSSRNPVDVPRSWIWDLPKRTVYFGTSTPSIFKGLTTEEIQHCFWKGFVCVRGFDRISRAPRPLYARLHFPASKVTRNKKGQASAAADDA
ncbi:protein ROS1A-like [Lolium rigidum]|uniref:protein ROS1A-like n=1 Tax=Lolium rigidum TaxID=89674 RepID=UPI001F5DD690|nr:protein ROS1A-like [Lolium rigidum]